MDVGGPQSELLYKLMSATTQRSKVIASNVANQNTPGYTRQILRFEDGLREAMERGDSLGEVSLEVLEDHGTPARSDGNNVTLEIELNAMRENRMMYETYSTILAGHFELLRTAIKDGN